MNQDGIWLSIIDYATVKKISISTIRRSIKAKHLIYKEESGKYFIWMKDNTAQLRSEKNELALKLEIEYLKKKNRELSEELADSKMLLSVYENKSDEYDFGLPPLPEIEL